MAQETTVDDRRKNKKLRALFDEEAYEIVAPFLDTGRTWGGQLMEFSACRMLREAFPELSSLEIAQLVSASVRIYKSRNPARSAPETAAGDGQVKTREDAFA